MNLEMQTTLSNTFLPKSMTTILKASSEQLQKNDQSNTVEEIADPVPEIHLECEEILKAVGRFWDGVSGGYLPEDLVVAARREEIDWYILKVSMRLFQCKIAKMRA